MHLAASYRGGVGVERDPARARELEREACDLGRARVCFDVAMEILTEDPTFARSLARKSCELGHGAACYWYVARHLVARTPPNWIGAAPLLARGCQASHAATCLIWGDLLRTGVGTERNVAAANDAYAKACERGEKRACDVLRKGADEKPIVHELDTPDPPHFELRRTGQRGQFRVVVDYCVASDGTTEVGGGEAPPGSLDAVARGTVENWRFAPTGLSRVCSQAIFDLTIE